ncbi:tail fiber/spike domain-containing protein [Serratia fonticola]
MSSEGLPVNNVVGTDVDLGPRSVQGAANAASSSQSADSAAFSADRAWKFSNIASESSQVATGAVDESKAAAELSAQFSDASKIAAEEARLAASTAATEAAAQAGEAAQQAIDDAIRQTGYAPVDSFELGATLELVSSALRWVANNNAFYSWRGTFPKIVPLGSTPETTGGFGENAWVDVSDLTLRTSLALPGEGNGVNLVHGATKVDEVSKYILGGGIFCGVFFASSELPYINLLMSNDGLRFGDPIRLAYNGSPMLGRDPCIINFKNKWIISRTSYTAGVHDFGLYVSDDLLNWNNITCKMGDVAVCSNTTPAPGGTVPASNLWAPELVEYDGELYVFISIRANPDELDINGQLIPSFRPYVSKCTDINNFSFSPPVMIDIKPGNKIDPDVIYDETIDMFVMVIKNEYSKALEVHRALSLNGPYTFLQEITLGEPVEGPSIVKIAGGAKRIYFDPFSTKTGIQYVETTDWTNYSVTKQVDMARMRHGSVSNVKFDGNKFYDVIKLSGLGSSRSEVQTQTQFVVLSAGTRTIAPAEDTVYCTSGSSVVEINLMKGAARFSVCVRSNNNFAGITLSGLVLSNYVFGFGKNKDVVIELMFDAQVGKYRVIDFTKIAPPINLVTSAGTIEINKLSVSWAPDYGCTYITNGADGDEITIYDLPLNPADGFYFNLMVRSAVSRGAIRLKAGGASMGNPTDIVISGATGDDSRPYRVEKVGGRWYLFK